MLWLRNQVLSETPDLRQFQIRRIALAFWTAIKKVAKQKIGVAIKSATLYLSLSSTRPANNRPDTVGEPSRDYFNNQKLPCWSVRSKPKKGTIIVLIGFANSIRPIFVSEKSELLFGKKQSAPINLDKINYQTTKETRHELYRLWRGGINLNDTETIKRRLL